MKKKGPKGSETDRFCSFSKTCCPWTSLRGRRQTRSRSSQAGQGTYASQRNPLTPPSPLSATSTLLVTGSADNTLRLWDVASGQKLFEWEFPTAVKRVAWSEDSTQILAVTEARMGYRGALRTFTINRDSASMTSQSKEPSRTITFSGPKATVAAWGSCDEYIVTGHEDGKVALYYHDTKEPETGIDAELEEQSLAVHEGVITDMQMSSDRSFVITSGKDKTAKVSRHVET